MYKSSLDTIKALIILWSHLTKNRKRQVKILFIIMIISGFAELSSVGSVIPFLSVLIDPERLFNNIFFSKAFNLIGINQPKDLLLPVTILLSTTFLISAFIRIFNLWLAGRIAAAVGSDLSYICYRKTLYRPYSVHISKNTSEVIASLTKQLDITVESINTALSLSTGAIISTFLIITLIFLNWIVALFSITVISSIYLLIAFFTKKKLFKNSEILTFAFKERIKSLQEGLGGIRDVIMNNDQDFYVDIFQKSDLKIRKLIAENNFIGSFPRYLLEAIVLLLISFFAYFLNRDNIEKDLLIPLLGTIVLCAQRILPSIQLIYYGWVGLSGYSQSILEVIKILKEKNSIALLSKKNKKALPIFENILLRSVKFSYNNNYKEVLTDINLEIKKGESIGIIGTTGGGKTTLLDILMGLLKPTQGQLIINGIDIYSKEDQKSLLKWRKCLAHVPQNIYLSDNSIAENIAFGIPSDQIDMKRVKTSAEQAEILKFIQNSPNGYNTYVGERGISLSGGQRQRIGIARALYKESDILILDEATSALDINTERKIMESLSNQKDNLTIIMIAHRLSSLKNCNRVIKIEKGSIIADGSPEEII